MQVWKPVSERCLLQDEEETGAGKHVAFDPSAQAHQVGLWRSLPMCSSNLSLHRVNLQAAAGAGPAAMPLAYTHQAPCHAQKCTHTVHSPDFTVACPHVHVQKLFYCGCHPFRRGTGCSLRISEALLLRHLAMRTEQGTQQASALLNWW